ncbi:fatty acid desaturase family protein [Methylomonas albis]|uniref:Fatty acid desaturase n=1 Tax=Methylomonas albis TaxID=1854563 RepID=A0ABR9D732_9GAMM|nr:fatty acid desaturase [Methylomonas albis]MBD9358611.1 fatty acid desaturase [Methylomonas albis]
MVTIHPQLIEKDERTTNLDLSKYIPNINTYLNPRPTIYWLDFIGSVFATNLFIYISVKTTSFSPLQLIFIIAAAIFLYRSTGFIHEAVHVGKQISFFPIAFNILFGFVHKLPLYSYHPHKYHHHTKTYGTRNDPEYELLKGTARYLIFIPFFSQMAFPLLFLVRFGFFPILLPFIGKKGRNYVYRFASTAVLNLQFQRPLPDKKERTEWYQQDAACFFYNCIFFYFMASGYWPWKVLYVWYGITYLASLFNFYRTLSVHNYYSNFENTNFKQQILDTNTYEGSCVLGWLYPIGTRFHALHHLFPQIPYHNLAKMHRLVLSNLPDNHPYRETIVSSFISATERLPH